MTASEDPAPPLRFGMVLAPTVTSVGGVGEPPEPVMRHRLEELCRTLGSASGLSIKPVDFDGYPALLDAVNDGLVDLAWLAPVVAMRAVAAGRVIPITQPVRRGISSFHSALFTRTGSRILRPTDLAGVRAAWVDRNSASGYLVIRAALRAQDLDLERAFADEKFYGSHEAVVRAVRDGAADVGATFVHHDPTSAGIWRAGWGEENVHIIARVGPIPSDVIAAGIHVPVQRIRAVQKALVSAEHQELGSVMSELFECDRMVVAESEHLTPLEDLLDFLDDIARPWKSILPPAG